MNPTLEGFIKFHGDKVSSLVDEYYISLKEIKPMLSQESEDEMSEIVEAQAKSNCDINVLNDQMDSMSIESQKQEDIIDYDINKCMCRLFNNGIPKQCSRKKIVSEIYCKSHLKKFTDEGIWGFGLINDNIPTHHVRGSKDEGKKISWRSSVSCIKSIKKEKINVNKDLNTKFDESSGLDTCFKCHNTSSNNQFTNVDNDKYCLLCYKSYLEDLNIDMCQDCNSYPCDCKTIPLSDEESKECNDILTEDTNDYIYYQGVHYYYDEFTNIVALNYEEVGLWNIDTECIDWYNDECMNKHLNHPNYISK